METAEPNDSVKEKGIDGESPTPTGPASFNGRLNIASYAFIPKPVIKTSNSPSPRRSIRVTSSTTPSPSPAPLPKRKSSQNLTPSSSPRKKSRSPSGYAPPSTYAHLPELQDVFAPNLICIFIGLNPGILTATTQHAYAHPSNLFWKLVHSSGCTTRRCRPEEDRDLPKLFGLGNTNIVARPTRNGSELSKREMDDGVHILEEKIRKWRPEAVCMVGKGIWESVWRVRHGKGIGKEDFRYGWQDEGERMGREEQEGGWEGARIFVATSTSGLAASLGPMEKERIWRELGIWVEERRREREI